MTFPVQVQHAIGSTLQRYTKVPEALPDPGTVTPPDPGTVTLPYLQTFDGLSAWPAEWTITGSSSIASNAGVLTTGSTAGAPVVAYLSGMPLTPNVDVVVTYKTPATIQEQNVTVGGRSDGQFNGTHTFKGYWAQLKPDANTIDLFRGDGAGGAVSIATAASFTFAASTSYRVRFQAVGTTIRARIWAASGTEPTTWKVSATDSTHTTGRAFLTTKTGTTTTGVRTATFDDLTVKVGASDSTVTTIFGYNWNNQDNPEQTIAGRKAKFGSRNPCPRVYTGATGHPSTFSGGVGADEKRICWSFKADPDGTMTATYLAGTTARDTKYIPWLESIPANWTVFWCYHHEVNGGGALEISETNYLNTYKRMREALNTATLASGVKVYIVANFMAYQVDVTNRWSDSWVPPTSDCDMLTWDMYGNPGQNTPATGTNKYGTGTGAGYNSTYPLPAERLAAMFRVTERTGYADSWGILEVNTPLRNWDWGSTATAKEKGRAAWHQDIINYFLTPPMTGAVPPKICLLWEAPSGQNWNQAYGYNYHPEKSPPGSIAKAQANIDNSPLWDVWEPYLTGTPVGG